MQIVNQKTIAEKNVIMPLMFYGTHAMFVVFRGKPTNDQWNMYRNFAASKGKATNVACMNP